MIKKFNAFDILWYASEDSEKLENWIAFTNVNVIRTSDINKFAQMAYKSRTCNLIIIITGSFAEKAIPLLDQNLLIPNIIIYCINLEYHKKWSEKYKSIIQVFTQPSQIFEFLLKIHSPYDIPLFSYRFEYKNIFNGIYQSNMIFLLN